MVEELKTFSGEAVANFQATSALVPSSRYLARAMLSPLPLESARTVVEFGPGTGTITRALLDALPPRATLLVFEINPRFRAYLQENFSDSRLVVVPAGAEQMGAELRSRGVHQVEAAVSSVGLTMMPAGQRAGILDGLLRFLSPEGVLTQYQYLHGVLGFLQLADGRRLERFTTQGFLRRYFSRITREVVWRNLPPAFVFACRR